MKKIKSITNLKSNENVSLKINGNKLFIDLEPYTDEITENYAKFFLEFIKKNKKNILEEFEVKHFVLSISGYKIGGLSETNDLLINEDTQVY